MQCLLSTRTLNKALIKQMEGRGVMIDCISFIETLPVETIEVQQEVEMAGNQVTTVVFTSANAVVAVSNILDSFVPEWRIYCIGHKTRELAVSYFGESNIEGTGDDAAELAELIIENDTDDEVVFFCGNKRRDELPAKLRKAHIDVNEITVYETELTPHKIEKDYDGVLFFSPSAADSFFSLNKLSEHTIAFVIGNTTAEAVKKYCNNKIITAIETGKDFLIEQAVEYFS